MSLKSRARRVQRERGMPYQKCLQLVRLYDEEAKGLARAESLPLGDADAVVFNRHGYALAPETEP